MIRIVIILCTVVYAGSLVYAHNLGYQSAEFKYLEMQDNQFKEYTVKLKENENKIAKYWSEKYDKELAEIEIETKTVYITKEIKVEADEIELGDCHTVNDDVVRLLNQATSIIRHDTATTNVTTY